MVVLGADHGAREQGVPLNGSLLGRGPRSHGRIASQGRGVWQTLCPVSLTLEPYLVRSYPPPGDIAL